MLKLIRDYDEKGAGPLRALECPQSMEFRWAAHGCYCIGHCYGESLFYTITESVGMHGRNEIIILKTEVGGSNKILAKGSIAFADDADLQWIEKMVNRDIASMEEAAKPQKAQPKGDANGEREALEGVILPEYHMLKEMIARNPDRFAQALAEALTKI